jgi:HEAT repeat protein
MAEYDVLVACAVAADEDAARSARARLAHLLSDAGGDALRVSRTVALMGADCGVLVDLWGELLGREDWTARLAAVIALRRIGSPAARARLKAALEDDNVDVRSAARWALERLGVR